MEPLAQEDPDRIGDYRVRGRLGVGGMGTVYLASSPAGRGVAVKLVHERFVSDIEYRARFRREVAAARAVTGVFTAPVLDAGPDAARPWLATAYLPGLSLREVVAGFGPLPAATAWALGAGLAEALADIHRAGLTHRDLKPSNVMLTADGPRVIDFGIARPEDATAITQVGMTVGTPGFMSPEQFSSTEVGPASDVFSLGAVLAFAATGVPPYGAGGALPGLGPADADLSGIADPRFREIVSACLVWEPQRRPSAADLLSRLSDAARSVQGLRWLPAPVAEAIDRSAAEARQHLASTPQPLPDAVREPTGGTDLSAPTVGATPVTVHGSRRASRRLLLAAAAAAAATVGVVLWRRSSGPTATFTAPSARTASPSAPLRVVPKWTVRVSDHYPDLHLAGGVVLAHGDEKLHALDPATGKTRWTRPSLRPNPPAGGVAYVISTERWSLSAIDAASGDTRWTYRPPLGELPWGTVVTRGVACFGIDRIRAVDAADGQPRWASGVSAEHGLVATAGMFAAAHQELVGLDAARGRVRWRYEMDEPAFPAAGDGLVIAGDRHGVLHAVHAATGKLAWQRSTGGMSFEVRLGGGVAYAVGVGGQVYAVAARTGELVWSRRLGRGEGARYGASNALGLAGDTLYVACTDRHVYALNAGNGRVLWRHPAQATLTSGPVVAGGLVCVGLRNGYVTALDVRRGGDRAGP